MHMRFASAKYKQYRDPGRETRTSFGHFYVWNLRKLIFGES